MELSSPSVKADINVTPLVDVVLVLLIIFMVVTPMLQKGQAVKLPQTNNPATKPDADDQILVVVTEKHDMFINKDKMSETEFNTRIKETFERNQNSAIVIKADSRLTYGDVKKTMMKIKEAGFQSVGLIADRKPQGVSGK
jgi:biopolymer transport protein ExbD